MNEEGKIFEKQFKKSCRKQSIFCQRLRDNPAVFTKTKQTKYTHKQPYDFLIFKIDNQGLKGNLICVELKNTKQDAITIQLIEEEPDKMIHAHQIKGLCEACEYKGVYAGFLLNYQRDKGDITIYLDVKNLLNFVEKTGKRSLSIKNALLYGGIIVQNKKLKINYEYDIDKMVQDIIED